ncbi:MAG: hypothetical protein ACM3X4_00625 [Ignavibacteriales bacterium]
MQKPSDQAGSIKVPWPRFIGMGVFLLTLILANFVTIPGGPWGLGMETFYVGWLSYAILVVSSFIFIYNQNSREANEGGAGK